MSAAYLIGLIVALLCLGLIDYRYKLALFAQTKRTLLTLAVAVGMFVVWDVFGIWLGVFYHGGSDYALPFLLAPDFPYEELFFLTLLCYVSLLVYRWIERRKMKAEER